MTVTRRADRRRPGRAWTKEKGAALEETRLDYWVSSKWVLTFWVKAALAAVTYGAMLRPEDGAGVKASRLFRCWTPNTHRMQLDQTGPFRTVSELFRHAYSEAACKSWRFVLG